MLRARRRAGLRISLRSFGSAAVGAIFAIGFLGLMVCSDITLGLIALVVVRGRVRKWVRFRDIQGEKMSSTESWSLI